MLAITNSHSASRKSPLPMNIIAAVAVTPTRHPGRQHPLLGAGEVGVRRRASATAIAMNESASVVAVANRAVASLPGRPAAATEL